LLSGIRPVVIHMKSERKISESREDIFVNLNSIALIGQQLVHTGDVLPCVGMATLPPQMEIQLR
jgi:hypothetical protein